MKVYVRVTVTVCKGVCESVVGDRAWRVLVSESARECESGRVRAGVKV